MNWKCKWFWRRSRFVFFSEKLWQGVQHDPKKAYKEVLNFTWNLLITLFITRFFKELEQIYVVKIIGSGNAKTELNKLHYENMFGYLEDPYLPMADLVYVIKVSSKLNDKIVLAMSLPTNFVITSHSLVSVFIFNHIKYWWFYIHLFHL